jgi:hypothetical protein
MGKANNCRIIVCTVNKTASIKSTRPIKKGEELYIDYGATYAARLRKMTSEVAQCAAADAQSNAPPVKKREMCPVCGVLQWTLLLHRSRFTKCPLGIESGGQGGAVGGRPS